MASKKTRLQPTMVTDYPSTIKPDMANMSVTQIQTIGSNLGIPGARQYRKGDIHYLADAILANKIGAKKYMDSSKAARDYVLRAHAAESRRRAAASHAAFVSSMAETNAKDDLLADASRAAARRSRIPRGYVIDKEADSRLGIVFRVKLPTAEQIAYIETAESILKAIARYLDERADGKHDDRLYDAETHIRRVRKLIAKRKQLRSPLWPASSTHEAISLTAIADALKDNDNQIKEHLYALSVVIAALIKTYFKKSSNETGGAGVAVAASSR